ncbi:hypothetical protein [Aureibacter tunicatorum]|uniref:Uncharacterized protein n=1 Tax=Aureibacter tunicatorum TaxID=866807 RepID=A0AAE4BRS0_9BACT|nr:hypothetical protein [Aureibacter tunicatorum]MDR6240489.1 hypothetical protein [Aureibacter tunicatorum]
MLLFLVSCSSRGTSESQFERKSVEENSKRQSLTEKEAKLNLSKRYLRNYKKVENAFPEDTILGKSKFIFKQISEYDFKTSKNIQLNTFEKSVPEKLLTEYEKGSFAIMSENGKIDTLNSVYGMENRLIYKFKGYSSKMNMLLFEIDYNGFTYIIYDLNRGVPKVIEPNFYEISSNAFITYNDIIDDSLRDNDLLIFNEHEYKLGEVFRLRWDDFTARDVVRLDDEKFLININQYRSDNDGFPVYGEDYYFEVKIIPEKLKFQTQNVDTLWVTEPSVYFTNPDKHTIQKLQANYNEDLYNTIIDDVVYYKHEAEQFLEKKGVAYQQTESRYFKFISESGKEFLIDNDTVGLWGLYIFDGKNIPQYSTSIDIRTLWKNTLNKLELTNGLEIRYFPELGELDESVSIEEIAEYLITIKKTALDSSYIEQMLEDDSVTYKYRYRNYFVNLVIETEDEVILNTNIYKDDFKPYMDNDFYSKSYFFNYSVKEFNNDSIVFWTNINVPESCWGQRFIHTFDLKSKSFTIEEMVEEDEVYP